MSLTSPPPIPNFLPENAPFTPEQRTWLNGLFAGLFGLETGVTPLSASDVARLLPDLAPGALPALAEDESAPWHDPAMPMAERLKLAEGMPLPRRMMAAMAICA
jgi:sulfite reductase (NADPH) flavoprotein alpha-component